MEKDQVLKFVEELLVKYGAVINPGDDPELCEKLGIRPSYIRNGIYYRTELAAFEEDEVVLISATDNPEYAKIGAHDNIAGFSVSYSPDKIEKEVRFALEIEPYPDTYPEYEL
ncbi:MAG: hypothetical protein IKI20_05715 [Lachnospiraceae bacterium]|nr:hypothetical protein [Lachnospiraceae bacterium]